MTIRSFTSTRRVGDEGKALIVAHLRAETAEDDGFITGACAGGDAVIGLSLVVMYGSSKSHTVAVPYNTDQVDPWWEELAPELRDCVEVVHMPRGSDYKYRNQWMVDRSDKTCSFPSHPEASQPRSGTWQTVRMARKADQLHCETIIGTS